MIAILRHIAKAFYHLGANAVVSPAIDAKSEGLILGVGAKIFSVAGPVLLYGTLAGSLYGVVYWVVTRVQGMS